MANEEVDVAIVGSGFCGMLVARELLRAGREVTIVERGGMKAHAQQLEDSEPDVALRSSSKNHESPPDLPEYPWDYVYGVGGSSLHWAGVAPRFLESDFELRSRYGVGRDWPLRARDLLPFYDDAEQALAVAGGGDNPLFQRRRPYPHPPHPYAPVDQLVAPMMQPYFPLAQARPTRSVGGRPACCGSATCRLCPVDARYSMLHTIADEKLLEEPGMTLRDRTVAARLNIEVKRVAGLELIGTDGERSTLRAKTVVLAANGIENAAILLRSDLGDENVGKWLYDHEHRLIYISLDRSARHGKGSSLATGICYDYAEGEFRRERGSLLVYPYNPGRLVVDDLQEELIEGRTGRPLRDRLLRLFDRTLVLDTLGEDLPRRERRVELSPNKDSFGLPLNRIRYPADSEYLERTRDSVYADLERRLRPLGAKIEKAFPVAQGAHQLGTCYMGEQDGVVDPDQRHHRFENLYVAGGSAFPTYSAHHPTLTIAALAIRLGRHLASSPA